MQKIEYSLIIFLVYKINSDMLSSDTFAEVPVKGLYCVHFFCTNSFKFKINEKPPLKPSMDCNKDEYYEESPDHITKSTTRKHKKTLPCSSK